ncbi:MAG: hypothetical protein HY320_09015 [Armatimonadetes bacterium]|nr:hypothetical protein [Armatimonadota bacterium]
MEQVQSGKMALCPLTAEEIVQRLNLPSSLSDGEAESIALCKSRSAAFVTNDRRARNYCLSASIEVFDLIDLLRALWKLGVRTKEDVGDLITTIEAQEGTVIRGRERILTD